MKRVLIGMLSVAAVVVLAGAASAQDAASVAKGEKVYADQKCSLCHSIAGKGNAKGSLDGIGSKLKADELHDWIVKPGEMALKAKAERKPAMPAKYAALPKADLDALVAYLGSLKK